MEHEPKLDEDLVFFSTIDDATKTWLATLHQAWALWKKSEGVSKILTDYFETAPNPYLSTLRILVNISDFTYLKIKSLSFSVMEEFSNWIKNRKEAYRECLVPDLKIAAFKLLCKHKNMQFAKMVSTVYEFIEHKDMFLEIIQKLIEQKKYKDAAQYAAMLQLQHHFIDPEILLIPLILQNKFVIMDEFLINCPEIQKSLVTYLDNLIMTRNIRTTLNNLIYEKEIPDININQITTSTRPITKLIARLVKQYNISPDLCPHLNAKRSKGALHFLMRKYYVDGSLSIDSWREMVSEAVGIDPELQLDLLPLLIHFNDAQEGLYWAKRFEIPKNQWPSDMVYIDEQNAQSINDGASTSGGTKITLNSDNTNYHVLNLPRDRIKLIDNKDSFEEFLDNGLMNVTMVGIDSEWKPTFGTKQAGLALIQIATENNIYILDVTTIGSQSTELWTDLGLLLFGNKHITKIGFGIAYDMTIICSSLPALSSIKTHGEGYLDLSPLWEKLDEDYDFVFPYKGDNNFTKKNLSKLVELCLGQKLDKSNQFSNWELRPLRESQIVYAALDAYCLLEIYNVLAECSANMQIPFQEICCEIQHTSHKSPKKNINKSACKKSSTLRNTSNENSCMNTGTLPKCDLSQNIAPKQGFIPESRKLQSRQKQNKCDQRTYNNQNKYDNQNRYDNVYKYDKHNRHNTKNRHSDQSRYVNQNRYDKQNRYGNQNRHDYQSRSEIYNRQDTQYRSNIQDRQDNQFRQNSQRLDTRDRYNNIAGSQLSQGPNRNLILAHKWRVVCDSMLGGLCCKLRMCGIDCLEVLFDQGGDESAKLAMRENRVLLTRNKNYQRFGQYLPLENCYRIAADTPDNQLREVLNHFRIMVTQNDIFSRCKICNHDEFVKIPKNLMFQLMKNFVKVTQKKDQRLYDVLEAADISSNNSEFTRNSNTYFTNSKNRTWRLSTNSIDVATCITKYKARIQIDKVPQEILMKMQIFYACEHCGKIYWDGSHLERALNGVIKDLIFKQ